MKNYAIVLAAGQGKRMKVQLPKCAHLILKKPMAKYVIDAIDGCVDEKILVVDSNGKNIFEEIFTDQVTYALQPSHLGTGDALRCALKNIKDLEGYSLVLPGDVPLIDKQELINFMNFHVTSHADVSVLTIHMKDPSNYGRIIRENGQIVAIREKTEASKDELEINEVNTGIYCIKNSIIKTLLPSGNNYTHLILPIIVENAYKSGLIVRTFSSNNEEFYYDVNDFYTLSIVENIIKIATNKKHLLNGVNIISPETVTISSEVTIEPGVTIYPNTFITGKSVIKSGAIIGPDSELHNAVIDEGATIRHSLIVDSAVGKETTVGPFAHLRNGTFVHDNCRIGNFVEIKNSRIGNGTKISHLTYLGDTDCGENVNWGCGCVTVNYDGKFKNKTTVGDNVFIGCNTNLIAPISIGNNVFIAAGSTITDDIPDEAFSIARTRQITKEDYARKYSYGKKKK